MRKRRFVYKTRRAWRRAISQNRKAIYSRGEIAKRAIEKSRQWERVYIEGIKIMYRSKAVAVDRQFSNRP